MRTAEECRRRAVEMTALAAKSPTMRGEFLLMAETWKRLERDSATVEGETDAQAVLPFGGA